MSRVVRARDKALADLVGPSELTLLNRVCEVIRHLRKTQPPEKGITGQLPVFSPAVSFGTLEEAMKGGGKMNEMMKAMMGGGAPAGGSAGAISSAEDEAEVKRRQEEKENAEKQRMAKMKQLQKQGRRVVRR